MLVLDTNIETPKVVFTKTLQKSQWANTDIATGNLREEIMKLKTQNGKDIIVYGGASLDSSLIKEGLIDDFHLFCNWEGHDDIQRLEQYPKIHTG